MCLDRHTLSRALKTAGLSFRQLRAAAIGEALERASNSRRPLIQKEVAEMLGFRSSRTVRNWRKANGR